uniref:Groucho/TLE N-terminal Q-rich domain-containing protein n=1 Tax=Schistocephalus solidus TaxID=70667 RepID=A0A0X3P126_SCHSO
MFPTRPPAPSGPGPSYKFTVVETCDRIKEEFNYVQQQCHSLQLEREKLLSERVDMQRICVVYYEMANGLNLEMHRQMEIAKRLNAILTQVIPFLSQEHQSQVSSAIERAKQVTMQELNSVLAAQMEDSKMTKFSNGSNMGLSNDQLEIYKQIQVHQMSSGGSPGASIPGSSGQGTSHSTHLGGSLPGSASFGPHVGSSASGMLPSSTPSISAALLNGLMSAHVGAGGVMMPPPGSAGLPLTGAPGGPTTSARDSEKFSADDKQRAAAAAAAAAVNAAAAGPLCPPRGLHSSQLPTSPFSSVASYPMDGFFGGPATSPSANSSNQPVPGRSSSAGGSNVRHNSGHSSASSSGGHHTSSTLLPPPPPPTPGSLAACATASSPQEEKRRKLTDSKECSSRENGGWRSADEIRPGLDKATTPTSMSMSSSRRASRQPLNLSPQLTTTLASSYPTTNSAPAVGIASNRQSQPEGSSCRSRHSGKSLSSSASGPGAYSYVVLPDGQTRPCALASAPEATTQPSLPRRLQHLASLPHGEVVCAVTIGPAPAGRNPSMKAEELVASETTSTTNSDHDAGSPGTNIATVNTQQSSVPHFAYTGGRGCVKLWDLDSISTSAAALCSTSLRDVVALASFDCLRHDSYVRSIKLFPDATGLVIGGESSALTVWDLNGPGRRKADLTFDAPACYALALSPDCKLCYSCCSDGHVVVWDIHNQSVVHQFHAHVDGASCIELATQGTRLWTGGLDHRVRCWDIRSSFTQNLYQFEFKSQVFSLGLSPVVGTASGNLRRPLSPAGGSADDLNGASGGLLDDTFNGTSWLAVGLESSEVEVVTIGPDGPAVASKPSASTPPPTSLLAVGGDVEIHSPTSSSSSGKLATTSAGNSGSSSSQHFRLTHHESCVLALRFAHTADWFVTTGKDHQVNAWRTPYGACLFETKEAASVLTCDISPDDKFIVTGSGDKRANLYEVVYGTSC